MLPARMGQSADKGGCRSHCPDSAMAQLQPPNTKNPIYLQLPYLTLSLWAGTSANPAFSKTNK